MSKRGQQGSGEERVTAKSRLLMNLTARMPSVVSFSASSNPRGTSFGYQNPGKFVAGDDRFGETWENGHHQIIQKRIMVNLGLLRSGKVELRSTIDQGNLRKLLGINCKKLTLIVKNLFSAEMRIPQDTERRFTMDRGNLRKLIPKKGQIPKLLSWAMTQQNLWIKKKDRVRKRQKRMSNVAESCEKHSIIWWMFIGNVKCGGTIQSFVKDYEDFTLKHMFDVTAQLVNFQDEIIGLDKIQREKNSWKRLSLIGDETVINFQSHKNLFFSDSVLCLGRVLQHPDSNEAWKKQSYRNPIREKLQRLWSMESRLNSSGTSSQDSQRCSSVVKSIIYWGDLGQTPETFTVRILFMSMFIDIFCDKKTPKMNVSQMPESVKVLARKFGVGQWSFIGQGSAKKWHSAENKEPGTILRKKCSWNSQKADIWLSVQQLHCPGVSSRAKDVENCR